MASVGRWMMDDGRWALAGLGPPSSTVHRPSSIRPSSWAASGDRAAHEGGLIAPPRWLVIALLGSLTSLTVHNVLDNLYVHGTTMQLGLLLGIASAAVPRRTANHEVTA